MQPTLAATTHTHADLVGWYTFDDSEALLSDSSGNENDLAVTHGQVTQGSGGGRLGSAGYLDLTVTLDEDNQRTRKQVKTPDFQASLLEGDHSLGLWFRIDEDPTAGNSGVAIFSAGSTNFRPRFLPDADTEELEINTNVNENSVGKATITEDFRDWHHYAYTYSAVSNTLNVYVDGTLAVSGNPEEPFDVSGSTFNVQFYGGGSEIAGVLNRFVGGVDDIFIADSALTQSEIQNLMNTGVIPEPASGVLALAGLTLLLGRQRR